MLSLSFPNTRWGHSININKISLYITNSVFRLKLFASHQRPIEKILQFYGAYLWEFMRFIKVFIFYPSGVLLIITHLLLVLFHYHLVVKEYIAQLYSVYKTQQQVTKAYLYNQLLWSKVETIKHITSGPSLDNRLTLIEICISSCFSNSKHVLK